MIKFIHFIYEGTDLFAAYFFLYIYPINIHLLDFSSCAKMSTDYEINDVIY